MAKSVASVLQSDSTLQIYYPSQYQAMRSGASTIRTRTATVTYVLATIDTSLGKSTMAVSVNLQISAERPDSIAESRHLEWSLPLALNQTDWKDLESGRTKFVQLARANEADTSSFWSDLLQPTIVVIAAGAIAALFFLIRS